MKYYKTITNDLIIVDEYGRGLEIETDGLTEIHVKRFTKAEVIKHGDWHIYSTLHTDKLIYEIDEDEFNARHGEFYFIHKTT